MTRGKFFLFPLIGMLFFFFKSNNENYLSQHLSIFSMVKWKLKANLVLNFSNYIPLLFFCIIFYVFLKYLPLRNCTLINYLKTKIFKNKCCGHDQRINIKPISNQKAVFATKYLQKGTSRYYSGFTQDHLHLVDGKNKVPVCSEITHEGSTGNFHDHWLAKIYTFIQSQTMCLYSVLGTVLGLVIAL